MADPPLPSRLRLRLQLRSMWHRARRGVHYWLCDPEYLVFAALILLHVIPIWGFAYFPSQDGPAPLVPVLVAEKLLLIGYVILLPVALRYALQAIHPASAFLIVFAFPLVYNFTLHMGFYNFAYSLPLYGFVLGYWLRHHDFLTLRTTLTLATLALLLYLAHPVSLAAVWLAIGALACWLTLLDGVGQVWQQRTLRPLWTACRSHLLMTLGAFLPTLLLMGAFWGR